MFGFCRDFFGHICVKATKIKSTSLMVLVHEWVAIHFVPLLTTKFEFGKVSFPAKSVLALQLSSEEMPKTGQEELLPDKYSVCFICSEVYISFYMNVWGVARL